MGKSVRIRSLWLFVLLVPSCKGQDSGTPSPTSAPELDASAASAEVIDAAVAEPPGPFMGSVTIEVTVGHHPRATLTLETDGKRVRGDLPVASGPPVHVIYDLSSRQRTVLVDADKTATTTTVAAPAPDPKPAAVHRSGVHESVVGKDCEDLDVTEANGKHETVCVAEGLELFDLGSIAPPGALAPVFGSWSADLLEKREFPLVALILDPKGALESRMQVTALDRHPVDASAFEVPADYRVKGAHR
jgi:hypothetical protein